LNILAQYVDPAYTLKLIEIDTISGQEKVLETLKYKKDDIVTVKYDDIAHI
jgi:hypothetical protein